MPLHDLVANQHWKTGHVQGQQLLAASLKFCKLALFCPFCQTLSPNDLNGFVCARKNVAGGAADPEKPHLFLPCLDPNYQLNERAAEAWWLYAAFTLDLGDLADF